MNKKQQKPIKRMALLMGGSACIISFSFPIDMIRTRLQTSPQLFKRGDIKSQYKGFLDCFRQVYKKQKWNAFWKGNGSNLVRFFISQSFNFAFKQKIQDIFRSRLQVSNSNLLHSFGINSLSATLGACITLTFIYPFQFCRQKLNNDVKGKKTIHGILKEVYKEQGIKGIYKGCINFFITAAIFRSFYFGVFDTIKRIDQQNLLLKIFAAYTASIIAIYIVYPLDTLRKRMITAAGQKYAYKNLSDAFSSICKKQGIRALYRGGIMIPLQAWTSTAILCFYDRLGQDIRQMTSQQQIYETF